MKILRDAIVAIVIIVVAAAILVFLAQYFGVITPAE